MFQSSRGFVTAQSVAARRSDDRERIIFRIGLLTDAARPTFCLVKNVSPNGAQVKLYGPATSGSKVTLQIGDDEPVAGRVAWVREGNAGVAFDAEVEPAMLLRAAQKLPPTRRRSSPRVKTVARVLLRSEGRVYAAALCDISISGAKVRTFKPVTLGQSAVITLPDFPPMNAYVRWADESHVGMTFQMHLPVELLSEWLGGRLQVTP